MSLALLGVVSCSDESAEPESGTGSEEATGESNPDGADLEGVFDARWTSTMDNRIAIHHADAPSVVVTPDPGDPDIIDFKPSWSADSDRLVFFRRYEQLGEPFFMWRNRIAVVNADGTGFHEITNGEFGDVNPTWTRDGSDQVIVNRLTHTGIGSEIYLVPPDGSEEDLVLVSNPSFIEWNHSGLTDGRLFMDRLGIGPAGFDTDPYLLTPNPGGLGTYEQIQRPHDVPWHKLSVSPSETRITYMKDLDGNIFTYDDAVLAYADLDLDELTVSGEVVITPDEPDVTVAYPRWTADERHVIFHERRDGTSKLYAYSLETGETVQISADDDRWYSYANAENLPK